MRDTRTHAPRMRARARTSTRTRTHTHTHTHTHPDRSRVRVPAETAGEVSSPGSTFCADSDCGIRSTPVFPQWHVTDPCHSAKSADSRLQLNTRVPYVCGFALSNMVVWCTQNARGDGSSFMWHQPCQRCKYTTSVGIPK